MRVSFQIFERGRVTSFTHRVQTAIHPEFGANAIFRPYMVVRAFSKKPFTTVPIFTPRFRNLANDVKLMLMAAKTPEKSLQQVVDAVGTYPVEAYIFVREGLTYTADKIHGESDAPEASRHISGRDLCLGLREYAHHKWGFLARTVLRRWNVTTTLDFGRIVFALVEHNHMQKTDDDTLLDFRQVYDFHASLENEYHITGVAGCEPTAKAESKK